jgi:hypothetical protein
LVDSWSPSWLVVWLVSLGGLGIGTALAVSNRFRRARLALGVVLLILAVLVTLNLIAISIDFHGAGGNNDCWPYCSTWQEVVGWTFWVGTPLVVVGVIAFAVGVTVRSVRSRSRY